MNRMSVSNFIMLTSKYSSHYCSKIDVKATSWLNFTKIDELAKMGFNTGESAKFQNR